MTGLYKMAFRIRAVNRFGPSRPSKPTSSFCPTNATGAPYPPFNLTFSSDCKNRNATLTWVTGKSNNASIFHFLIEGKSTDADDFWKVIANVTNPIATSYPLVNMTGLYKMAFRIKAFNRFGPSRPSKPTSSFSPINATGAPYPPFNLTFSSDCKNRNATLTWVTGKSNNASITHFLIEGKSTDADDFWKVIANVTNTIATSYPLVNMTGLYKMAFRISIELLIALDQVVRVNPRARFAQQTLQVPHIHHSI
ncbi:M-protein, striated muscle-like [Montipora capricornis]|uniref:M-protein, striated muscle-like n=1 Tax=Montipora capricornis TaxID=246305 RepID=UPI0035F1762A